MAGRGVGHGRKLGRHDRFIAVRIAGHRIIGRVVVEARRGVAAGLMALDVATVIVADIGGLEDVHALGVHEAIPDVGMAGVDKLHSGLREERLDVVDEDVGIERVVVAHASQAALIVIVEDLFGVGIGGN